MREASTGTAATSERRTRDELAFGETAYCPAVPNLHRAANGEVITTCRLRSRAFDLLVAAGESAAGEPSPTARQRTLRSAGLK